MADDPVKAVISLWYQEIRRALVMIDLKCLIPVCLQQSAPWFTQELQSIKQLGRLLVQCWRKSKSKKDQTRIWAHNWAYAGMVMAMKKAFFPCHYCICRVTCNIVLLGETWSFSS